MESISTIVFNAAMEGKTPEELMEILIDTQQEELHGIYEACNSIQIAIDDLEKLDDS